MNPIVKKLFALLIIGGAGAGMGYQYFMAENIKTELFPSGNAKSVTKLLGQTPHGKTTFYFDNASRNKSTVFTYVNGIKSGGSSTYHENGTRATEVSYANDEKNGIESVYSQQGQKVEEITFSNGTKGKVVQWDYHNRYAKNFQREFLNGVQVNEMLSWHPNGKKKSTVNYENGKMQGLATIWHDNATKSTESVYVEGIQQGKTTQWDKNANKVLEGSYENGKIAKATSWAYHSNGSVSSENKLVNGLKSGTEITYYDTTEKASEGSYDNDNKVGVHTAWHRGGVVSSKETYKLGKLHGNSKYTDKDGQITEVAAYKHGIKGVSVKNTYDSNGNLIAKKLYKNDILDGVSKTMFANGNPESEMSYQGGKLHGSVKKWNNEKSITEESTYVSGNRNDAIEWTYNNANAMTSKTNFIGSSKEGNRTVWHDNGNKSSSVNFTSNKKQGNQTTWFDTKVKKSEGLYIAGNKEGKHSIWHKNGKQSVQENYSNNRFEGLQTYWDDKGLKTKELEKAGHVSTRHTLFVDGKKHGAETLKYDNGTRKADHIYKNGKHIDISTWYDADGDLSRQKNYQNSILLSDTSYSKGARNGKTKMYYASGQLEREVDYVNDEKSGTETYYYNDGTKELEANYKADVLDGEFINYYVSGKVHKYTAYKDGTEHGLKQVFYKSGALHNELTFKDGEKDGKVIWYYENGSLDQVVYFADGARNDDKIEVYIPTSTGSMPINTWLATHHTVPNHSKGMTGWVFAKRDDGSNHWMTHYVNGVSDGKSIVFHTNGRKKREAEWKNSKHNYTKDLNGKLTDWNSNGNKTYEAYYKSNPDGKAASIHSGAYENKHQQFYKTTKWGAYLKGTRTYWNANGTLSDVSNYVNNKKTGLHTAFHTNGRKKVELTWKKANDEYTRDLNGKLTYWNKDGNKTYEAYYKSNPDGTTRYIWSGAYENKHQQFYKTTKHGAYLKGTRTYWNTNGTLSDVSNYVNNKKTGLHTAFHTNGRKKIELTWKKANDEYTRDLNGKLTDWNSNGNKTYEAYYKSNPDGPANYIFSGAWENRNQEFYKTTKRGAFFHGPQTFYDANGRQTKKVIWKNNKAQ